MRIMLNSKIFGMNFQQIGDSVAVNKAIRLELDSRQVQLWKAWHSPESYYRQKYANLDRLEMFVAWAKFKILDFIWGNGENALKLIRTFCVILLAIAFVDIFLEPRGGPLLVSNCYHSLLSSAPILFGVESPHSYPSWYLAVIVVTRLAFFGMFLSTLVKRLSRR